MSRKYVVDDELVATRDVEVATGSTLRFITDLPDPTGIGGPKDHVKHLVNEYGGAGGVVRVRGQKFGHRPMPELPRHVNPSKSLLEQSSVQPPPRSIAPAPHT